MCLVHNVPQDGDAEWAEFITAWVLRAYRGLDRGGLRSLRTCQTKRNPLSQSDMMHLCPQFPPSKTRKRHSPERQTRQLAVSCPRATSAGSTSGCFDVGPLCPRKQREGRCRQAPGIQSRLTRRQPPPLKWREGVRRQKGRRNAGLMACQNRARRLECICRGLQKQRTVLDYWAQTLRSILIWPLVTAPNARFTRKPPAAFQIRQGRVCPTPDLFVCFPCLLFFFVCSCCWRIRQARCPASLAPPRPPFSHVFSGRSASPGSVIPESRETAARMDGPISTA
ncbi:hypothetical protein MAPG_01029, partial [Magnaporthiopsis poae ATCC 64411]